MRKNYLIVFISLTLLALIVWGWATAVSSPPAIASPAADGDVYLPVVAKPGTPPPQIAGCDIFPGDNIWNTPVDKLPVHPNSNNYIDTIGASRGLHADFGSGVWPPGSNSPIGIPYVDVPGSQPLVPITFIWWPEQSDDGPYPVPPDAPIEGGPDSSDDRHVIVLDRDNCIAPILSLITVGKRAMAQSMTSAPTICAPTAGHRLMLPDCLFCPDWCVTTRWLPVKFAMPFGLLRRKPRQPISGRPATTPLATSVLTTRQWAYACVCAPITTFLSFRRRFK